MTDQKNRDNFLPQIVSQPDYKIRSAIYFSQQITDISKQKTLEKVPKEIKYTPVLEFMKINPTKYRIIIHKAKETFPLVFSESFHDGWKAYVVGRQWTKERGWWTVGGRRWKR